MVARPIGTFTKKIQCQVTHWVSTPPASRPTAPPADATNAYTPTARACSRGSGNKVTIRLRITADVSAPPAPCTNRAAMSMAGLTAAPQATDAAVNTASPARKIRRWPARSPSRPASSSRPPNAIRYALITQASPEAEKPRSSRIDGSATFTIVASSTIINMPVHRAYSARRRARRSVGVITESP
jgi:hypothetical protein